VVTIHQAATDTEPPVSRVERKFFVVPRNVGFAYALLRQFCRPDAEYPAEQINSLYFDTDDLEQYLRSSSGDFRKNKVRIRWYHSLEDYPDTVPVFVELKSRQGFVSYKQRKRLVVPVEQLGYAQFSAGIVAKTTLMDTIASFGHYLEMPVRPIIVICYWRYRFTEMLTGVRVSLDCNIHSSLVTRELGHGERGLRLPGGVIEVKGPGMELPVTLRRIRLLDTDWSRFSKYSSCLDTHLAQPGTVARLWPSGRMA